MRFIGAISLISLAAGSLEQSEQEPDADSLLQHAAFFKDDEDCGSEKCQPHTDPEPPKPPIKPPVKPVTTPAPFVNTPPPITRPPVTQPPKKDCENFFGRGAASLDQIISIVDPDVPALFCDLFNQKAPCTFIHRAQASGGSNCVSPTPPDKCHKYIKVAYSKCDGLEAIKAGTVDVTGSFDPQTGVFKGCEGNVTSTDYTYWAPNEPISDKPPPTFPDTYKAIKCSKEERKLAPFQVTSIEKMASYTESYPDAKDTPMLSGPIVINFLNETTVNMQGSVTGLVAGETYMFHIHAGTSCKDATSQAKCFAGPAGCQWLKDKNGNFSLANSQAIANKDGKATWDYTSYNAVPRGPDYLGRPVVFHRMYGDLNADKYDASNTPRMACGLVEK